MLRGRMADGMSAIGGTQRPTWYGALERAGDLPPIPLPISATENDRGCTCPPQVQDGPPWTVDAECPLHGYGAPSEDRKLPD